MIGISPEVSVIVPVSPGAKSISSAPGAALAPRTACRRLPGPESARLVTVNVAAVAPWTWIRARRTTSPDWDKEEESRWFFRHYVFLA